VGQMDFLVVVVHGARTHAPSEKERLMAARGSHGSTYALCLKGMIDYCAAASHSTEK
jgi:hypothetical protein